MYVPEGREFGKEKETFFYLVDFYLVEMDVPGEVLAWFRG
jgi:hypothetical protein